ncbi:hypothetical protein L3X38_003050 [Prunus dulcis]|uniref:Uncharacterized protein n=1 Tax=Prunus dulcis TaxID=3755 RepID=A0AAD4WV57_PRUDU|nr:hypothetical protein L3X38_003050 [Prunus dulcis]
MRLEIEVGLVLASGIAGDLVRVSAVETAGDLGLVWRLGLLEISVEFRRSRPSFGVEAAAGIGVEDLRSGFGAHIEGASRPRFGAQVEGILRSGPAGIVRPDPLEYRGRALAGVSRPRFGWGLWPRAGRCTRISCG